MCSSSQSEVFSRLYCLESSPSPPSLYTWRIILFGKEVLKRSSTGYPFVPESVSPRRLGFPRLPSAPPQIHLDFVIFGPWKRGESWPLLAGGLRFSICRVQVWWGGVQGVAVASLPIRSPRIQCHLDGNVEKLVGVLWSSRILSACGDIWIVKELHR
jgi:hypothetical protein